MAADRNGVVDATKHQIEQALAGEPMTLGYKPGPSLESFYGSQGDGVSPWQVLFDTPSMLSHPVVHLALQNFKGAIANAEFKIEGSSQQVADFALTTIERFFSHSLAGVQEGYAWGWSGHEVLYKMEKHRLHFDGLENFRPRDVVPLTKNNRFVGIRVRNGMSVGPEGIHRDLWGPRRTRGTEESLRDVPPKGAWFTFGSHYHRWFGKTVLYGAWRPWRRLSGPDGAETVADAAVYRAGYMGPEVRFPPRDQGRPGETGKDSARDRARELAEGGKAGLSIALPSTRDQHGQYEWDVEWPTHVMDVKPLLDYIAYLKSEVASGIGVPPELMEAADVGSGYSGRAIPMEAFLMAQQRLAEAIVESFTWQVLNPLLLWNFGRTAWAHVKVKSLLATKSKNAQGGAPQPPPQMAQPPGNPAEMAAPQMPPQAPPQGGGQDPLAALLGGQGNMSTLRGYVAEGGGWSMGRHSYQPLSACPKKVRGLVGELQRVRREPWRLSTEWRDQFAHRVSLLSGREFGAMKLALGVRGGPVTSEAQAIAAQLEQMGKD